MFLAWETPPSSLLTSKAAGVEGGEKNDAELWRGALYVNLDNALEHTSTSIWWGAMPRLEVVCGFGCRVTVGQLVKPDPASQIIVGHLILCDE